MSDNNVVERNWRGQYPPVAILQNTRRALSASAHSAKREKRVNSYLLLDLAASYQEVLKLENYIREIRNIPPVTSLPTWVHEPMRFLDESTHVL